MIVCTYVYMDGCMHAYVFRVSGVVPCRVGLRVEGLSLCLGSEGHPVAACTSFDPIVRAPEPGLQSLC